MVRTNTINLPGLGAGVVRIKGTDRALAMSVDGNGRYCYLDPRRGAMLAVAEAARNVACTGARPLGATNCLNFGNPERPAIMWQFAQAVEGIGAACRALGVPITGGNVSLYNETDGNAIYPTPVIGVVGLLEHADRVISGRFQESGDVDRAARRRPRRARRQRISQARVRSGARRSAGARSRPRARASGICSSNWPAERLIRSAHDCSDGGIAVTLAECCFDSGGIGSGGRRSMPSTSPATPQLNDAAALFGESASRVIVSVASDDVAEVLELAAAAGVPARVIGQTGGNRLRIAIGGRVDDRHGGRATPSARGRRRSTRIVA